VAAAIRMSGAVHVLPVGPLGEAVAGRLTVAGILRGPCWPPRRWPEARLRILSAWRPSPRLAAALDQACFAAGIPWIPVVFEHPVVRIGPAVVPGLGPCYTCARQRFLQHDEDADTTRAVHDFYDAHAGAGPAGYLPPVATIVAAVASRAVDRLDRDPGAEAGLVRQLDILTMETTMGRVCGLSRCPRCGTADRTADALASQLSGALRRAHGTP